LPNAPVQLLVAFAPNNLPIGTCRLLLDLPLIPFGTQLSDANGAVTTPIPIGPDPALGGIVLFGQYLVADLGGSLLGLASMSDGLQMFVGY